MDEPNRGALVSADRQPTDTLHRYARKRFVLDLVTSVILVAAAIATTVATMGTRASTGSRRRVESPLPKGPVSLNGAMLLGSRSANVALVMFSDFQCPFCAKFATDTLPQLRAVYVETGRLLLAYRHFPLEQIHPRARSAAASAVCAGSQGAFWSLHDWLFAHQSGYDETQLVDAMDTFGINMEKFTQCVRGGADAVIQADVAVGKQLGVVSTPSFVIGTLDSNGSLRPTKRFSGARSYKEFEATLDEALGTAASGRHTEKRPDS